MRGSEIFKHLILKISEGDEPSFSRLYDIYFSKVYNFAGCFISSKESRKEVISDVFLTLWNNRTKLPGITDFESYLFIITRNKSIDYLNKYKQAPAYSIDVSFEIMEDTDSPEFTMLYNELESLINKSINELPERCKLIFLMSRDEGFTYNQIAEILSLSESTVNSQMVIAIKKLGEALRKYLRLILLLH
jgi:RNA polymerase sigma-70 factor (ECF subfamily)